MHEGDEVHSSCYLVAWLIGGIWTSCMEKQDISCLLIVNTRSVHHILTQNPQDTCNVSLCPILDFANHHPDDCRATSTDPLPVFRSPPGISLKKGDQVYLKYGDHSNRFLFRHYGFVCTDPEMERSVDVDDIFESSLLSQRSLKIWDVIRDLLQDRGYWRQFNVIGPLSVIC